MPIEQWNQSYLKEKNDKSNAIKNWPFPLSVAKSTMKHMNTIQFLNSRCWVCAGGLMFSGSLEDSCRKAGLNVSFRMTGDCILSSFTIGWDWTTDAALSSCHNRIWKKSTTISSLICVSPSTWTTPSKDANGCLLSWMYRMSGSVSNIHMQAVNLVKSFMLPLCLTCFFGWTFGCGGDWCGSPWNCGICGECIMRGEGASLKWPGTIQDQPVSFSSQFI